MYRVARYGVIAFESRDSLLMRLCERLGLSQSYEHAAVFCNGCEIGGVSNTAVPNYVYRWTEREIEKTIRSYDPTGVPHFTYRYGHDLPGTVDLQAGSRWKSAAVSILAPVYRAFAFLFPRQQNLFAFMVRKPIIPDDVHPWLLVEEGSFRFNEEWGRRTYQDAARAGEQLNVPVPREGVGRTSVGEAEARHMDADLRRRQSR